MEAFYKDGNSVTPEVLFDPDSGVLSIKGKSIPMDAQLFFGELTQWLERYKMEPKEHTKLEIDLKYLNNRSIKNILGLLNQMKQIDQSGKEVTIEWSIPSEAEDLCELSTEMLTDLSLNYYILQN